MTTEESKEGPAEHHEASVSARGKLGRLCHWVLTHKKLTIPVVVCVVLVVVALVPFTRFAVAGLFLKQQFSVRVVDEETNKPVSSAEVQVAGTKALTDGQGRATVTTKVGRAQLAVEKKYYKAAQKDIVVPILKQKQPVTIELTATGRQIPVTVVNKISGKAVADISLEAGDAKAKTDNKGKATLVVPADKKTVAVSFSGANYNTLTQTLPVATDEVKVEIIPGGKLYFLSNQSGKLDVVRTDLDGSQREVIVAGTGKEEKFSTTLLASRDWRYLALHARRDSEKAKLYLVDTTTNKLTVMDEGEATFGLVGWSGHRFVYTVSRTNVQPWQPKRESLKSFDAEAQKITTLDDLTAEGNQNNYLYEYFSTAYILENEVVYAKKWIAYNAYYSYPQVSLGGKQATLNSVKPDSKAKKVIKAYDQAPGGMYASLEIRAYGPQEVYILYEKNAEKISLEEYENGQLSAAPNVDREEFYNTSYPTYLISPSGERSFWTDIRDGNTAFFVGDKDGENEKQITQLKDFNAYGWYTEEYLLLSRKGSELYIMPVSGAADERGVFKITDYYRAGTSYNGYGYGYGGL